MAVINVQNWTVEQVVDWVTGLSDSLSQYAETFSSKSISGQKLLTLMSGDLSLLGITRIGDQLLLHDAIQSLRDELQTPWITLQSLALTLSVRCKNYRSELTQQKQAESEALLKYHFQQQQQSQQNHHQSDQQSDDHHHHHHHSHHHHHHHLTPKFNNLKSSHHHHRYHPSSTLPSSSSSSNSSSTSSSTTSSLSSSHHHQISSSSNNLNSSSSSSTPTLTNAVSTLSISNSGGGMSSGSGSNRLETIPTTSLASASYLLDAGKVLIRWLTRFPFQGKLDYDEISRKLSKHCFELAVLSQRDTFADNAIEEVQYLCTKIIELCETLIHSKDSLVIQPAGIDIITLRKRNEQDWGLQFESSYWGLHQITGVKLSSPAQQSGHLERGDEILQVNYQTILAWPQSSVISLLHENENEVILTVKRRPRHASTNLLLIGGNHNSMYLNKVPNRKSFFERRAREQENRVIVVGTVPTSAGAVVGGGSSGSVGSLGTGLSASSTAGSTSSVGNSGKLVVGFAIHEVTEDGEVNKNGEDNNNEEAQSKDAINKEDTAIRNDNEKSNSNADSKRDDEKASARFWKLYPKPKYLIKRRATVTGASPTETRPPVTFINDDTPTANGGVLKQRFKNDGYTNEPSPNNVINHHQQVHHRRSTPVTTRNASGYPDDEGDGSAGARKMQLLNPSLLVQRPPLDKARSAPEREMSLCGNGDSGDNEVTEESGQTDKNANDNSNVDKCEKKDGGGEKAREETTKHEEKVESHSGVEEDEDVFKETGASNSGASSTVMGDDSHSKIITAAAAQTPPNTNTTPIPRPKPKPRLSKSSIGSLKKQDNFEEPVSSAAQDMDMCDSNNSNVISTAISTTAENIETAEEEPEPIALHRGILHIRSQLRKQSSSNSASALPHLLNSSGSAACLSSSAAASVSSPLLLSSSSPRWIRQNAVFYSNRELEIVNPVGSCSGGGGSSGSFRTSSTSSLSSKKDDLQQQNFKVKIAEISALGGVVRKEEFTVLPASEVHSRPFAFKITSGDAVTYYLAAESQLELDAWISVMTTGKLPIHHDNVRTTVGSSSSTATPAKPRNNSSSTGGDIARRNFSSARAPYKRSVSLGSSQSPNVSTSNLSSSSSSYPYQHHHSYHHPSPHASSTPPPSSNYYPHTPTATPPYMNNPLTRSANNLARSYYSSSTNLSSVKTPPPYVSGSASYLNKTKSSSLKTDWFLRGSGSSGSGGHPSSNISSITITSKKVGASGRSGHQQQPVSTQYPTPTGTPTKQQQSNSQQPMMGVAMYRNKIGSSGSNGECSTSPTRKYRCPNCSYVVKVDKETQTLVDRETGDEEEKGTDAEGCSSLDNRAVNAAVGGEVKLVFFDNGGESRV